MLTFSVDPDSMIQEVTLTLTQHDLSVNDYVLSPRAYLTQTSNKFTWVLLTPGVVICYITFYVAYSFLHLSVHIAKEICS